MPRHFAIKFQQRFFAMKNVIPLIVAVVLALAAVYMVSRMLVKTDDAAKEQQVSSIWLVKSA